MTDDPIRLDFRGLNCPLPVLKARRALARVAAGRRVVIEATDPMSAIDIPHMCGEDGHLLIETRRGDRLLTFVIERGAQPKPPENPDT